MNIYIYISLSDLVQGWGVVGLRNGFSEISGMGVVGCLNRCE